MFKNLFNGFVAVVLMITIALTAREALATAGAMSGANTDAKGSVAGCMVLPSQLSVHTEYVSERRMWVTYTSQGPTGLDGGLMAMRTVYPTCSR